MKKLLTVLLTLPVVFLMNCGSDDDNNGDDYLAALVGQWMMTNLAISGCNDSGNNGSMNMDHSASYHITINSDGSYRMTGECGTIEEMGTIRDVTANSMVICPSGETDCTPDSYTMSGNTIIITAEADESTGCIETVTLMKDMNPADLLAPAIGTWTMTSMTRANCNDSGQNGSDNCITDCPTLTISSDCTYAFSEDGSSNTETGYIVVSETLVMLCPDGEDCDFMNDADSYTLDGNILTVMTDDDSDFPGCDVTYVLTKL